MEVGGVKLFTFTIWDLVVFTTFIALVFAIPLVPLQFLMAAAVVTLLLLGPLFGFCMITASRRAGRKAEVERMISEGLTRVVAYAAFIGFFGGVSMIINFMKT